MQTVHFDHRLHITVYEAGDVLPPYVDPIPAWLANEASCRASALRIDRPRFTQGCIAVWPSGIEPRRAASEVEAWTAEDLRGVLLADSRSHRCFGCGAWHEVLYPVDTPEVLEGWRHRHSFESGCPTCGAEFATSRLAGLMINPFDPEG
ncbi:hypothetical protein [Microtetraspora malaysiensis]|uniref:hypothetical protein n=1 Tax=Microtetraspora malaysiensis TaxID=161358 RepID=UPI0012FB958C|nr:hypothetical protein [Microtetraspora malaysiensis]